jgi:hypothetical protein
MHTDRKIGFAMGILLIGIVAALFFRNEPLVDNRVPTVRREQELNERLKERDVAVYMNETEPEKSAEEEVDDQPWTLRDVLKSMDKRNKMQPSPVSSRDKGTSTDSQRQVRRSADGFRVVRDEPGADGSAERPSPIIAAPEAVHGTSKSLPLLPVIKPPSELPPLVSQLAESTELTAADTSLAENDRAETTTPVQVEFDEYVVKYGDTLSAIAERMLGSQARYLEIFEANRDRMSSPDRLDVGKPIRIPRLSLREQPVVH